MTLVAVYTDLFSCPGGGGVDLKDVHPQLLRQSVHGSRLAFISENIYCCIFNRFYIQTCFIIIYVNCWVPCPSFADIKMIFTFFFMFFLTSSGRSGQESTPAICQSSVFTLTLTKVKNVQDGKKKDKIHSTLEKKQDKRHKKTQEDTRKHKKTQ